MIQTNTTALRKDDQFGLSAICKANKNPLNSEKRENWFLMVDIPQEKSR